MPYKAKSDRAPDVLSKPILIKSHVVDLESDKRPMVNLSMLPRSVYLQS